MNQQIGFIGCGKMAQAMIAGLIKSRVVAPSQIKASAFTTSTLQRVENTYSIQVTQSNIEVAKFSNLLVLAVKPELHSAIIEEIKGSVADSAVIITVAAGVSLSYLENTFDRNIKAVRSMPNTPSLVGEGMSAIAVNSSVTEADLENVETLFRSFGKVEVIEEALMDSIPAISGSSPAYVYMFIEALADGGVMQGIPRAKAYKLAAQAILGAAKMVLETDKHPGELKDQVCTPGGATIKAVAELEEKGLRAAVLSAMNACTDRIKELSVEKNS
jgi:pyrroline-5-carboxylate reductase